MIYGKGMKNMFENAHDLYKSKEWKNLLQTLKLERVNESGKLLCEYCGEEIVKAYDCIGHHKICLLYTSPSPRDRQKSRMPSSA